MRNFIFLLLSCCAFTGPAYALLPPLWQNVAELKSLLNDQRMGELLEAGEVIVDIKKTHEGWMITTNKHQLPVLVNYQSPARPGPVAYTIEFGTRSLVK